MIMLTKDDKKFIVDSVGEAITDNNDILVKEILALFEVTNFRIDEINTNLSEVIAKVNENLGKRIDSVNENLSNRISETNEKINKVNENLAEKIDQVLDKLKDDDISIKDYEKRIEKLEEQVFPVVT